MARASAVDVIAHQRVGRTHEIFNAKNRGGAGLPSDEADAGRGRRHRRDRPVTTGDAQRPPSICLVSTVPVALTSFMAPHIRELAATCRITLVTTPDPESWTGGGEAMADLRRGSGVTFVPLAIPRRIAIAGDIKALVGLWRLFRRERFDLVQSITPKAGLLAMVAAWAAGVPVRVHWFVGQVWATKRGVARWILKTLDRVTAGCSTHLLADSASQRAFLVAEGVAPEGQITVLGHGSV